MIRTLFFLLLISLNTHARKVYEYHRPIWSMGMGGVYTPFPRESDIPTTNPAFLRYVKAINLEILNLMLGAPGLSEIQNFQDLPPMDTIADLNNYMGKTIWTGFNGRMSVVAPYLGMSIYQDFFLKSYFTNPLIPEWYLNFISDLGMTYAAAVPLGSDLTVGFAMKRINRWGGEEAVGFDIISEYISSQDSNVVLDQFLNKGMGYGMDLSFLYKTEKSSMPYATLVWKDLGSTTFQKTSGIKAPPHIPENLILGVGYEFDTMLLGGKAGFEYRNIRTPNMQIGQKLHAGVELSLPLVDVRLGMNQGYATYGMGLDLWFFQFDIAQYTVEEGYYPGQTPSQRIQMGLTLDLSVDADFGLTGDGSGRGGSSSRRKLKQRR